VFLYFDASNPCNRKWVNYQEYRIDRENCKHTCIRVLTTSTGVLPKTDAAPAIAPNVPTRSFGTGFDGSPPLYQSLHVSITKNRMAWLLPCLIIVAVTPLYTPPIPKKNTECLS
jgi:hypothetical protein